MGKKIFGEEKCKEMLKHSLKEKEKGEKYCDCEACKLARKVIKKASLVTKKALIKVLIFLSCFLKHNQKQL